MKAAYRGGCFDEAEAEAEMPRIRAELQAIEDQIRMAGGASEVIALEPATCDVQDQMTLRRFPGFDGIGR